MSKFILGSVQFGLAYGINNKAGKPTESKVFEIFDLANSLGIVTLDTAEAYGNAHEIIGNYHLTRESKFKINTKFCAVNKELFVEQVSKACNILGVDNIDTCFYHSYADYKDQSIRPYFIKLLNKSLIEKIGVSVYTNDEFEEVINDPEIKVIQLPFNLFDNFYQRGNLIVKAKEKGKIIQVRSVFLQGLFFVEPNDLKGNLSALKKELIELNNIAKNFSVSISELCIQYVLHHRQIDNVIIGVDSIKQLKSNINSSIGSLSTDVIESINAIKVSDKSLLYPYNWK